MSSKSVLAVDLGAESGRVMRLNFDGTKFIFEEIHRFPNIPVEASGTLYWDVLSIWHEIQTGIAKSPCADSLGIDCWGVDFALLDKNGKLLSNPLNYRDKSSSGMMEWVFQRVPKKELFQRTGTQSVSRNGIYLSLIHI